MVSTYFAFNRLIQFDLYSSPYDFNLRIGQKLKYTKRSSI